MGANEKVEATFHGGTRSVDTDTKRVYDEWRVPIERPAQGSGASMSNHEDETPLPAFCEPDEHEVVTGPRGFPVDLPGQPHRWSFGPGDTCQHCPAVVVDADDSGLTWSTPDA